MDPEFREFDITLRDADLEDFLALMDQQGQSGPSMAPGPGMAPGADFDQMHGCCSSLIGSAAGLQLQPHSRGNSPLRSSSRDGCSDDSGGRTSGQVANLSGGSSSSGGPHIPIIKHEAGTHHHDFTPSDATGATVAAPCPVDLAAAPGAALAGSMSGQIAVQPGQQVAFTSLPTGAAGAGGPRPTYLLVHPQQLQANPAALAAGWPQAAALSPGAMAAIPAAQLQVQLQAALLMQQQQQQQQPYQQHAGVAAAAAGTRPAAASAGAPAAPLMPPPARPVSGRAAACASAGASAAAGGVSHHSTVEKQRRDRLNSLIEELADLVPPSDPRYAQAGLQGPAGAQAAAGQAGQGPAAGAGGGEGAGAGAAQPGPGGGNVMRRPKHVVLADTIGMLKGMQQQLRLDESTLQSLRQQVAAASTAAGAEAGAAAGGDAMGGADAAAGAGASGSAAAGCGVEGAVGAAAAAAAALGAGGSGRLELPNPPSGGAAATGVIVEQAPGGGPSSLYVKVSCRDRKGLLCDLVGALRALPVVICSAAITTTRDGKVHDVFEVKLESEGVCAEDVQCAVCSALMRRQQQLQLQLQQQLQQQQAAADEPEQPPQQPDQQQPLAKRPRDS